MPRLNPYQQQTTTQLGRADAEMMGAGEGRVTQQVGGQLFDLGAQIQRRQDVIDRVQKLSDFDQFAVEALTAVESTDDIGRAETLQNFGEGLRQKADEILAQHGGGLQSRAEMEAQLKNQVSQYMKSANAASVKAQQQFIGRSIEQQVNVLTAKAADAPEMLTDVFDILDADIDKFKDALTPEQEQLYKTAGRSNVVQGAIDTMLQRGQWSSAEALVKNPEVLKYLDPGVARQARLTIAVDKTKAELEQQRQANQVKTFTGILGRDLTPVEVERVMALPPKKDMTPADEITQLEIIKGRPASQYEIDRIFGLVSARGTGGSGSGSGAGGMFGNSLKGRALDFVTNNMEAFATGMMSDDQRRRFEASVVQAYAPSQRFDPATGQFTTFAPTIPEELQYALQMGNSSILGGGSRPAPAPGIGGQPADQPATQLPASAAPTDRTIWDRRNNVVGPVSAGVSALNSVPGVGPVAADALVGSEKVNQIQQDRVFIDNASRDLIRTLQNNPRFSEGERQAIEKEVSISPEVFNTPESYSNKLKGISQSLSVRIADMQANLNNGNISNEERKRSLDGIAAIRNYMSIMGVPPTMRTPQEAQMLPSGTKFLDPKGNELIRR